MHHIRVTYEIAMAAGRDAGNCSMAAGRRKAWAEEDFDKAIDTFRALLALCPADEKESKLPY